MDEHGILPGTLGASLQLATAEHGGGFQGGLGMPG